MSSPKTLLNRAKIEAKSKQGVGGMTGRVRMKEHMYNERV